MRQDLVNDVDQPYRLFGDVRVDRGNAGDGMPHVKRLALGQYVLSHVGKVHCALAVVYRNAGLGLG